MRRINTTAALACLFLFAAAPSLFASHATLTGETFQSLTVTPQQLRCEPTGAPPRFKFVFTVVGVALGPYPGTFTEVVDVEWFRSPNWFTSTFVIDTVDSDGNPLQITGTKSGQVFGGFCINGDPSPGIGGGPGTVSYTAQINGQTDVGVSQVSFQVTPSGGTFNETFTSTLQPAVVVLQPASDVNPVSTGHTVTAQAFRAGQPASGVTVAFTVTGSVETSGECTTDASGTCTFTYQGPDLPGTDLIRGCPEGIAGGTCGTATKIWVLPPSTPGQVTGGGGILHGTSINGVTFGFNAKTVIGLPQGRGNVIDHNADIHIKLLDVTTLVVAGTHAVFFGNASFNGTPVTYRVDVDDIGEGRDTRVFLPGSENNSGVSLDTFRIQLDNGYSAGGMLTQGNIQIHK